MAKARLLTNYQQGYRREREIRLEWEARGWIVNRGGGSKGGDLVAGHHNNGTFLIEIKTTKAGPWADFGPAKRKEFLAQAKQAGWKPLYIWHPANKPRRLYFKEALVEQDA